jgi:hypothetical protein
MMFEIPIMQGFILFVGYPVYALALVLMLVLPRLGEPQRTGEA